MRGFLVTHVLFEAKRQYQRKIVRRQAHGFMDRHRVFSSSDVHSATFSPFVLEFISGIVALHPVFQQFVPAHLANVQALPVKQILFCGAMVPTLLPVRPGPHLIDAGLL